MRAIIDRRVPEKLSALLNGDREKICSVWNRLREDLENNPMALKYFRGNRDQESPDDYFIDSCHLLAGEAWLHLDFLVSDKQALDEMLFVDEVS